MRETFHWNSKISLSRDVLTRGGHRNRKERERKKQDTHTHTKSSSSLSLISFLFAAVFPSGRGREGEINVKTKTLLSRAGIRRLGSWLLPSLSQINNCIRADVIGQTRLLSRSQAHREKRRWFLKLHFSIIEMFMPSNNSRPTALPMCVCISAKSINASFRPFSLSRFFSLIYHRRKQAIVTIEYLLSSLLAYTRWFVWVTAKRCWCLQRGRARRAQLECSFACHRMSINTTINSLRSIGPVKRDRRSSLEIHFIRSQLVHTPSLSKTIERRERKALRTWRHHQWTVSYSNAMSCPLS